MVVVGVVMMVTTNHDDHFSMAHGGSDDQDDDDDDDDSLPLADPLHRYYKGNYDTFEAVSGEKLKNQRRLYEAYVAKRQHMQDFIDKFRCNANRAALVQSRIKVRSERNCNKHVILLYSTESVSVRKLAFVQSRIKVRSERGAALYIAPSHWVCTTPTLVQSRIKVQHSQINALPCMQHRVSVCGHQ
jgi:hypothetical protein